MAHKTFLFLGHTTITKVDIKMTSLEGEETWDSKLIYSILAVIGSLITFCVIIYICSRKENGESYVKLKSYREKDEED